MAVNNNTDSVENMENLKNMETKESAETKPQESLEDSFKALEEIVSTLEGSDISLEDSFAFYNRGMTLLKECNDKIDLVEKKIKMLDLDGKEQDF